jgi:hypothetical protein
VLTACTYATPPLEGQPISTPNLKRRHNTWYAVLNVPRPLRALVGKNELVRSLRTSNAKLAATLKWDALRAMQRQVDAAVANDPQAIALTEAHAWKATLYRQNAERWTTMQKPLAFRRALRSAP